MPIATFGTPTTPKMHAWGNLGIDRVQHSSVSTRERDQRASRAVACCLNQKVNSRKHSKSRECSKFVAGKMGNNFVGASGVKAAHLEVVFIGKGLEEALCS